MSIAVTEKQKQIAVEMRGITKAFGTKVIANKNVDLTVYRGEILAILGENGCGKTTLMNMIAGIYYPDEGQIFVDGEEVVIRSPKDAYKHRIGMVHQHFKLVDVFNATENIVLGVSDGSPTSYSEAKKRVEELTSRYGFHLDFKKKIHEMSVSEKQTVEIIKVLYRNADILILDEPTAVLTPQEIEELMEIMRGFAREGKSILFITHKLNEIMAVADRCTVLRKGKYVGTVDICNTNKQELSNMMVGRPVQLQVQKGESHPGEAILSVRGLTVPSKNSKKNAVSDVSFDVRAGEIVCIAGIDGNGQTELVYGLTGMEKASKGTVTLLGTDISKASIHKRNAAGISHIPEDRHKHGLVLDDTLENNIVLQRFREPMFQRFGFIKKAAVRRYAERIIGQYDVRSGQGAITTARSMSGGNQQKAIIGREVDRENPLLIAVQPTRGLDVGAIEYIHSQLVAQRDAGKAVLLVSLELDEVMNLSDRILVMYEGEIVGELDPKTTTVQELGLYMAGAKRNTEGGMQE